jgi:CO dehydrogenase/acetyl-CoA synthase alpha subunit
VNYHDKLWAVRQFIEENFDDVSELAIALGLSVEDVMNLLPDVLVANYNKFFHDLTEEEAEEIVEDYDGVGEDWEE